MQTGMTNSLEDVIKVIDLLKKILPHVHFVMIVIFVTLLIVDICNPFMDFINSNITKGFLWFYCILSLATGTVMLIDNHRNNKKDN